MVSGVKLPDVLREKFEEVILESVTIQAKYQNFCAVIHEEQKAVTGRSKALWKETMDELGLQGEWRYQDGVVTPVDEPETK